MYNWRTLSFLTFGSMFWLFSVLVATGVWLLLSSQSTGGKEMVTKKEEDIDTDDEFEGGSEQYTPTEKGIAARTSPEIKAEEEDEPSAYASNEDGGPEEDQASESNDGI